MDTNAASRLYWDKSQPNKVGCIGKKLGTVQKKMQLITNFFQNWGGKGYFMQTCRTIFKSVRPIMTFSIPSIFRVRMPPSTAEANNSATRARS
jgi:hypothetical protein